MNKQNNTLFDYEMDNYISGQFSIQKSSYVLKYQNIIYNDDLLKPLSHVNKSDESYVADIVLNENHSFTIFSFAKYEYSPWIIINKSFDSNGYKLRIGDIIKFGKIIFLVKDFIDSTSKEKYRNMKENDNNVKSFGLRKSNMKNIEKDTERQNINMNIVQKNDKYDYNAENTINTNFTGANDVYSKDRSEFKLIKKTALIKEYSDKKRVYCCKICLGEENSDDNPLINPCNCIGSVGLTHLECIRIWIHQKLQKKTVGFLTLITIKKLNCEICNGKYFEKVAFQGKIYSLLIPNEIKESFLMLESIGKKNVKFIYVINFKNQGDSYTLGRANEADIRLNDVSISRFHAKILLKNGTFYLTDNNSKFGTLVKLQSPITVINNMPLSLQYNKFFLNFTCLKTCVFFFYSCFKDYKNTFSDYNNMLQDYENKEDIVELQIQFSEISQVENFNNVNNNDDEENNIENNNLNIRQEVEEVEEVSNNNSNINHIINRNRVNNEISNNMNDIVECVNENNENQNIFENNENNIINNSNITKNNINTIVNGNNFNQLDLKDKNKEIKSNSNSEESSKLLNKITNENIKINLNNFNDEGIVNENEKEKKVHKEKENENANLQILSDNISEIKENKFLININDNVSLKSLLNKFTEVKLKQDKKVFSLFNINNSEYKQTLMNYKKQNLFVTKNISLNALFSENLDKLLEKKTFIKRQNSSSKFDYRNILQSILNYCLDLDSNVHNINNSFYSISKESNYIQAKTLCFKSLIINKKSQKIALIRIGSYLKFIRLRRNFNIKTENNSRMRDSHKSLPNFSKKEGKLYSKNVNSDGNKLLIVNSYSTLRKISMQNRSINDNKYYDKLTYLNDLIINTSLFNTKYAINKKRLAQFRLLRIRKKINFFKYYSIDNYIKYYSYLFINNSKTISKKKTFNKNSNLNKKTTKNSDKFKNNYKDNKSKFSIIDKEIKKSQAYMSESEVNKRNFIKNIYSKYKIKENVPSNIIKNRDILNLNKEKHKDKEELVDVNDDLNYNSVINNKNELSKFSNLKPLILNLKVSNMNETQLSIDEDDIIDENNFSNYKNNGNNSNNGNNGNNSNKIKGVRFDSKFETSENQNKIDVNYEKEKGKMKKLYSNLNKQYNSDCENNYYNNTKKYETQSNVEDYESSYYQQNKNDYDRKLASRNSKILESLNNDIFET